MINWTVSKYSENKIARVGLLKLELYHDFIRSANVGQKRFSYAVNDVRSYRSYPTLEQAEQAMLRFITRELNKTIVLLREV